MARLLFAAAFAVGALAIIWMSWVFASSDAFALVITLVIAAAYVTGFRELLRFRGHTESLRNALTNARQADGLDLGQWLQSLPETLRNPVRLRIEGDKVPMPAPTLTPFLTGLLVMLGLLGTFVGMVDTLKGAVVALEGSTELQAIREGLAAPIKGLGLAFGTSVAGVAGSALLGLAAAVCRRERLLAVRELDTQIPTTFRAFSIVYSQQQAFESLQTQVNALPDVAAKLADVSGQLQLLGEGLGQQLVNNQTDFHQAAQSTYQQLADSVGQSLRETISESAKLTGESIKPVVTDVMQQIRGEISDSVEKTHAHLHQVTETQVSGMANQLQSSVLAVNEQVQQHIAETRDSQQQLTVQASQAVAQLTDDNSTHLQAVSATLESTLTALRDTVTDEAEQQRQAAATTVQQLTDALETLTQQYTATNDKALASYNAASQGLIDQASQQNQAVAETLLQKISELLSNTEQLVQTRIDSESTWIDGHQQRVQKLADALHNEFSQLRVAEEERGNAAVLRLGELQAAVTEHLGQLGNALEQPMSRLIETASETPKAAAEVISQLRNEISKNIERDNSLLQERQKIMEELSTLSASMEQASQAQNQAAELLVNSSTEMLEQVGERFSGKVDAEVERIADVVDHVSGSATEMSSLAEGFAAAVTVFSESNQSLIENLGRIEAALEKSNNRSDEQLGYYVAQAREIIDHSMMSQKEVFEEIRKLSRAAEAEAM